MKRFREGIVFILLCAALGAMAMRFLVSWLWFGGLTIGFVASSFLAWALSGNRINKRLFRTVSRWHPTWAELASSGAWLVMMLSFLVWTFLPDVRQYRHLSVALGNLITLAKIAANLVPITVFFIYTDRDPPTEMRKNTVLMLETALKVFPPVLVFLLGRKIWKLMRKPSPDACAGPTGRERAA